MRNELIIGMGEIGKAVKEAVCPDAKVYDIKRTNSRVGPVSIMHVCFPYDNNFIHNVQAYMIKYEPDYVIIWSTVQIGTTKKLGSEVVHSPVEGKHPNLAESIETATRWIGYNNKHTARFFDVYFAEKGIKRKLVKNSTHTEALKLISTTEYGINIVFAAYKAQIASKLNMPYELTKEWNQMYNDLYEELELDDKYQKFVLDAPEGKIGGHCIVPNSILLNEKFPDELNERIINHGSI